MESPERHSDVEERSAEELDEQRGRFEREDEQDEPELTGPVDEELEDRGDV